MDPASRRFALFTLLLALALPGAAQSPGAADPARVPARIDDSRRSELKGQIHPAVRYAVDLGPADPAQRLDRLTLVLRSSPRQQADLEALLQRQQDPAQPEFRRWLTPAQFALRFGVADGDLARLRAWLSGKGLQVDAIPAGSRSIVFSGTVGQVDRAFAASFHRYRYQGETHIAASRNPSVPVALAGVVSGFAALHDFRYQPMHAGVRPVAPRSRAAGVVTNAAAGPALVSTSGVDYLGPADFATIYDINAVYGKSIQGGGRSIAVLGQSDIVTADISSFRSLFGLSTALPTIITDGTAPGLVTTGDELESDLDLEWAGAIAPAAALYFVTSTSVQTSAQYAVSQNVADIISLSYGSCEGSGSSTDISSTQPFWGQLWQQAAAQGISVFVAAGDSGPAGCLNPNLVSTASGSSAAVNALCSSPYDTCVGGTEFSADLNAAGSYWSTSNGTDYKTALGYIGESVWNQSGTITGGSGIWAGSGGSSSYYAKPAWQYAIQVSADGRRDVPDLSVTASPSHDSYVIYTSQGYTTSTLVTVGGTSASAPAMAGITALIAENQGGRLGNVNPALYALSTLQAHDGAAAFHRITSGNNSVPGLAGASATATSPDYNTATGLGSPDVAVMLANWSQYVPPGATLTPNYIAIPSAAFTGTAAIEVGSTTAWTATVASGTAAWLSLGATSGTGPSALDFVALANTSASTRSGTITVAGATLTVEQAGTSTTAQIGSSSSSLAFGSIAVGTTSASQRLYVSNTAAGTVTLSGISLGGTNAAEFSASGNCAAALALAGGASCYLDVNFSPSTSGSASASLQVSSNASTTALSVALSGTATAASASADVPLPPWSLALLALCLAAAVRRPRR